MPTGLLSHCNY